MNVYGSRWGQAGAAAIVLFVFSCGEMGIARAANCSSSLHPVKRRIAVSQQQRLTYMTCADAIFAKCIEQRIPGKWMASGGTLQVAPDGRSALFSSNAPGKYTITATSECGQAESSIRVKS
jgi:hypothetical protein